MIRYGLAGTVLALLAATGVADPAAEDIRGKVRAAVGYDAWARLEHGVVITGTATAHGATAPFTLRLHPDGRYAHREAMPLGADNGYDGKGWWARQFTTPPLPADLISRDDARLESGLLGHRWLAPDGGFTVGLDPAEHRAYRPCLVVRHPDAPGAVARAYLDPHTWLPTRFVVSVGRTVSLIEPSDWRVVGGARVPARFGRGWTPGEPEWVAASVAAAGPPPAGVDPFAPPPPAADTTFDPAAPARAEAKLVNAVLAVRVTIDGRPGPWLGLNTTAGITTLTPAAAAQLGLPAAGRGQSVGVGLRPVSYRTVGRLGVGPAAVSNLVVEEDPGAGRYGLGGFLGSDALARLVVEADFRAGTVAVHDPKAYRPPPGTTWQEARFAYGQAFLAGTFEGAHTGPFRLATVGQDPLVLRQSATRKLGLLDGRAVEPVAGGHDGGLLDAYAGTAAEFRVLGRAARGVKTFFLDAPVGREAFPHEYGAFGPSVLGPGTLVLDYPGRRVGFRAAAE